MPISPNGTEEGSPRKTSVWLSNVGNLVEMLVPDQFYFFHSLKYPRKTLYHYKIVGFLTTLRDIWNKYRPR